MLSRSIILDDGNVVSIEKYLGTEADGAVSPHLTTKEVSERAADGYTQQETDFVIAALIIEVFEALRSAWGKPIQINSGWRSRAKQEHLHATNPNAASYSPHEEGFALDLDCNNDPAVVASMVNILRTLRKQYPIRIGWKEYRESGANFVHMDIAPHFYGKGGPYELAPCSKSWREAIEW